MIARAALGALVAAAVLALPASAAREANLRIEPGRAIGKVRIGMTFAEVKRVLGRPTLVNRRQRSGFGKEYIEYDWGLGKWTVGFSGSRGKQRASLVGTELKRDRTPAGIGVGSTLAAVRRAYSGSRIACPRAARENFAPLIWDPCRLGPANAETMFRIVGVCTADLPPATSSYACPTTHTRIVVFEVIVKTAAAPKPVGT